MTAPAVRPRAWVVSFHAIPWLQKGDVAYVYSCYSAAIRGPHGYLLGKFRPRGFRRRDLTRSATIEAQSLACFSGAQPTQRSSDMLAT